MRIKACATPNRLAVALLAVAMVQSEAVLAQPPTLPVARLFAIFPPGGKAGSSVDVTISGIDLEGVSKLLFSDPLITAAQKTVPPGLGETGPQGAAGQFTLTIAPDAKPGLCEVRAIGKYGVSNPRTFVVGTRGEIAETEPNNTLQQAQEIPLGSVINGLSNGATDQDYFKFTCQRGQRVIVDCWAYRIDSRMDATLVLFDSSGKEIDRNRDTNRRDPLLDFVAPADGIYFLEIHDFLYAGSNEHFYRFSIGSDAYLDFVFPPAGLPGSNEQYTLYGRNLPGGQPSATVSVDGKPLESLSVQIPLPADAQSLELASVVEPDESGIDSVAYRLTTPAGPTNSVMLGYASAPVIKEQEPNDDPSHAQMVTLPCEIAGQFHPQQDRDWFTFQAKAGEAFWIEVYSQRLGLPTDPYLLVQQVTKNDKGEEQVKDIQGTDDFLDNLPNNTFDMKTDDPAFRFVAPAEGTYRILLRNLSNYARPDPRFVYRLTIHPDMPDFRVVAKPRLLPFSPDPNQNPATVWSPLLRRGGAELIDVVVFRRDGFDGEVQITVEGLPTGVTCSPATIAAGQKSGVVVLSAAEDAPESISLINIVGKSRIAGNDVVRPARSATMVWGGVVTNVTTRNRLSRNLAIAVSGNETAPFFVDLGQNVVLETCKAGKVQLPVKLVRRGDFKSNVVLSPSSLPPNVRPINVTLDPNAAAGNLEINVPPNVPAGTYSFSVLGTTQVSYARDPEAVKVATDRKAAVDKIVGDLAAESKAAAEAKSAAEKKAVDMATATQKARELAQAAAKAAQEAAAKAKTALEAKTAADKALAEAEAQAAAAAESKAAAEKAAATVETKVKEAAAVQQAVAKAVTDATNRAKPININLASPSPTVTLRVAEAPITMALAPATSALKQGTTLEMGVTVARLYGFADAVLVKPKLPQGVNGVKIAELTIPADQTQGKLVIEAAADATPGGHALNFQAISKFNGQELSVAETITLTIEKAEPAK